jgi:hypothetical protein
MRVVRVVRAAISARTGSKATDIAIYDFRLRDDAAKIIADTLRAQARKGVVIRIAYDHATDPGGDGVPATSPGHLESPAVVKEIVGAITPSAVCTAVRSGDLNQQIAVPEESGASAGGIRKCDGSGLGRPYKSPARALTPAFRGAHGAGLVSVAFPSAGTKRRKNAYPKPTRPFALARLGWGFPKGWGGKDAAS